MQLVADLPRILRGGASTTQSALAGVDAELRAPVATSRRISVLQLRGAVGATTAAAFSAATIAARRSGRVLAVDATGTGRLGEALAAEPRPVDDRADTVTSARLAAAPPSGRSPSGAADEVTGTLDRSPAGAFHLAVDPPRRSAAGPSVAAWQTTASGIVRFFDFVITDWGVRDLPDVARISDIGHTVCIVADASRASIEDAASVIPAVTRRESVTGVVLAIIDVTDERESRHGVDLTATPARVIRVPSMEALREAEAGRLGDARLRTAQRMIYLDLVAALASAAQLRSAKNLHPGGLS